MTNLSPISREKLEAIAEAKSRGLPIPAQIETELKQQAQRQAAQAQGSENLTNQIIAPDVAEWITSSVTIEDPHESKVSIIKFDLWPAQRDALSTIIETAQIIVLKARQLGMSWLVLAYALWLCIYHANQLVMVFSKDQESANEMIRRVKGMYVRLAEKVVVLVSDNVTTLAWSNGSRIKSFAATEDAGSSFTASLTILDEFAKMRYAEALYTSVKPTINDGGRIIIISTAKGKENPFHQLWTAAVEGLNKFKPIFIPWSARPGRTAEWYDNTAKDALTASHHSQEYPATPDEAFVELGATRFLESMTWWDTCKETIPALNSQTPIVVALDAGITNDSFGLVATSRYPSPGRNRDIMVRHVMKWMPQESLGGKVDFNLVREECWRLFNNFRVICFTYDPYQLHDFATNMQSAGCGWWREFSQGKERLTADKQLFDLITNRRVVHDGNPELREHLDNADKKTGEEENKIRIVKRHQNKKIDLTVCLSMSSYVCLELEL